jgi:geranylgeranyl pyrophosphate synthase
MLDSLFATIPKDILMRVNNLDLNISSENCNQEINRLLQRTVLVGGKRLRPLLTYLMGNLVGLSPIDVTPYSKAIELVHAASLSHDDVVDNATTRRGRPTINASSSNKNAVLAGDYLLADVIVELSELGNLELVSEMARIIQDLAEGEWIQLDAQRSRKYTREIISTIAHKKTASVMSWCCVAPAIVAGLSPTLVQYARNFGVNLGVAFQLVDDTLDFSGNSKKDYHLDLENGVINSVIYEWLALNPELMTKFQNGEDIISLWDNSNLDEAIDIIRASAEDHLQKARDLLEVLTRELYGDEASQSRDAVLKPIHMMISFLGRREF